MEFKVALAIMNIRRADLAEVLGVTPPLISMWENGKVPVPKHRQQQINDFFGVPIIFTEENEMMKKQQSEAFMNGRRRALAAIDAKLNEKYGADQEKHPIGGKFVNSNPTKQRSSRERLGLSSNGLNDGTAERHREASAFQNSLAKVRAVPKRSQINPFTNYSGTARASDGLKIIGPAEVRQMLKNSQAERAELFAASKASEAEARRRLGLTNGKRDFAEKLADLLDEN